MVSRVFNGYSVLLKYTVKYTVVARTLMARLPGLFRTRS